MAKEEGIGVNGVVAEERGNGFFLVKLDNGCEVLARVCGKMTQHKIRVYPDDRVIVEISPYDLTRGRITQRFK